MEYILSAFWGALDMIFVIYFCGAFFEAKKPWIAKGLSMALASIVCIIYSFSAIPAPLPTIFSFLFIIFSVRWLYKGPWIYLIFVTVLGYIIAFFLNIVTGFTVSGILGISYADLVWRKLLFVATETLGKFLSFFFAWICRKIRRPKEFRAIQCKWIFLAILFSTTSFVMILAIFFIFRDFPDLSVQALVFCGIIALADVCMLYLLTVMEKSTVEMQKLSLLHQQMDIQAKSIQALESSYRSQRKLTHDFRNHLRTISTLVSSGNILEVEDYINQLQSSQTQRVLVVNSNHPIVDAVLNMKYQSAVENSIDITFSVNDLASVSIAPEVLVVILSNLLDNAIEACCRLSTNRVIRCEILAEDGLFISIQNTSNPVVLQGKHIETSKSPKEDHGFGLMQIQYLLDQLKAEYTFGYDEGWFSCVADLPKA